MIRRTITKTRRLGFAGMAIVLVGALGACAEKPVGECEQGVSDMSTMSTVAPAEC